MAYRRANSGGRRSPLIPINRIPALPEPLVDRDKIARYGINVADVQEVIETAVGGKEATKVYEGLKVFGLAVRFPEPARNDLGPIREILISASRAPSSNGTKSYFKREKSVKLQVVLL
jgi:heavy metal efflux system protein